MILLTTTSDQLQFSTSAPVSTDWNVSWNDVNFAASTMVPGSAEGNVAAAATTVLAAPPASGTQRQIKFLSIVNRDAVLTQTVTVQKLSGGTYNLTGSYPLQPGWSLQYVDSSGFMLLNAAGAIQYVGAAGATGATGSQGPVGQYLILDADQGEEGMPIPGNQGPIGPTGLQGSAGVATYLDAEPGEEGAFGPPGQAGINGTTGAQGPQGVATFLDAEVIDPDLFVVPGSPGAPGSTGALGPQGVATFLEGEIGPDGDIGPPGVQGPQGTTGASGPTGPAVYLDADPGDEGQPGAPGLTGPQGVTGAQGPAGYGPPGSDGDQGDDGFAVPGPVGPTGSTGPTGPQGVATYLDAEVFEPDVFVVPGSPGAQGITGAQGPLGYGPPGSDGDQGDDGFAVPGNPGAAGATGAQGPMGPADLTWLAEIPDDPPPFNNLLDNVTLPLDPAATGLTAVAIITDTTTYTSAGITLGSQIANQGKAWRVKAIGQFVAVSSATARNAQVAVFWGSTQLTAISVAVLASTAQTTQFRLEVDIYATSTTALWVAGNLLNQIGSTTALALTRLVPASSTVSAGAQTIDVRFSMSAAVATDEWAIDQLTIERIK